MGAAIVIQYVGESFGSEKGDLISMIGNWVFSAFAIILLIRMLSAPLILHFGSASDDSHGSARFADKREIAPLVRSRRGLLIGRDLRTQQLLRSDEAAHL
ncbi:MULTISPECIES: hypothetical protein [Rhizobium]|uniref:Uncharacterized protein n=2 Tax=Rhizobium TaxID=379 RepID=K0PTJ6_9HYPH|nr:hypothetical protein [Rhizobium mesoamericanum]KWV52013.1 hypothetical protein AS026_05450 [Rhizobium altiplani]CCM80061.1 hypothetical protein BN77_p2150101 [Rhizobium mesoamericanum STM3625]